MTMKNLTRRHFLTGLVAVPGVAAVLAACGSDAPASGESQATPATDPTAPTDLTDRGTVTGSAPPGNLAPLAPTEVRLRIDTGVGAFTTAEMAFARMPTLLVMGDGTAFRPGAQLAIYPGPLLPAIERGRIADDVMATLMQSAADRGLLTTPAPDYLAGQPPVADVGSTVVRLAAGPGESVVHDAYALGFDDETAAARQNLADFVTEALSATFDEATLYQPARYGIWAQSVNPAEFGTDPAPTVVPWPVATVALAAATSCTIVEASAVAGVFDEATQLTFFEQNGATYAVAVRAILPDTDVCP